MVKAQEAHNHVLSDGVKKAIDVWLAKFPEDQRRSAVLMALRIVQDERGGHLEDEDLEAVAAYLQIPKIAVYEAASFYTMYKRQPVGKVRLRVCTSISCNLCGSKKLISDLEKRLRVKIGETTSCGRYTLEGVECLAACANAPVVQVNETELYTDVTPSNVEQVLAQIEQGVDQASSSQDKG